MIYIIDIITCVTKLYLLLILFYRGKQIPFRVFGILADAPARASGLKIASHTGKHGCHKCQVVGIQVRKEGERRGRTTFPNVNAPERTDLQYRNQSHAEHHHLGPVSVLTNLGLDMVKSIPVEPMHLFDIGFQKKQLLWFTTGKRTNARLKKPQVRDINF